jgi:mono/diheme cytochrome c family protein
MKKIFLTMMIVIGIVLIASATQPTKAHPPRQFDDEVEQGEYMVNLARCVTCHTPIQDQYNPVVNTKMTEEQIKVTALTPRNTLDLTKLLSGGRRFGSEEAGFVYSANLTPHEEFGIGTWTKEQFHTALRTGVDPEGRRLASSMPLFPTMADSDIDAIYAYLQSLEPNANDVPKSEVVNEAPPGEMPPAPLEAPNSSDKTARATYLTTLMGCTGCHTPTDENRRPIDGKFLAGRQPFEQPYGTVYAGNITPHEETGIGKWTTDEIKRALTTGVRIDGRRLAFMPWQDYSRLVPEDLDAIVYYLQNVVQPVDNSLPTTDLQEQYIEFVSDSDEEEEQEENTAATLIVGGLIGLAVAGALVFMKQRRTKKS